MMNVTLANKVDQYTTVYLQLHKALKWKVTDSRTLMMAASLYVVKQKDFNLQRFIEISDDIKKNVGMFSTLNSPHRFTIAAMLDVQFENPIEKFFELMEIYDQLIDSKFSRDPFTYLCAYILLSNEVKDDLQTRIERSVSLYRGMKSNHFFLTSSSDYPLAVLLANKEGSVEQLLENIEHYYNKLNQNGFGKGNDLQFLSHVLSLHPANQNIVTERCTTLFDEFKRSHLKLKKMHYPVLGLLSFLDEGTKELDTIQEIVNQLNQQKQFKWHKDLNLIMAINFLMSEKMEDSSLLGTNMYTIIESMIQAQQAVMVASVTGAAIATSSDGG
ncbi:DUF4003 domain-containing protein [Bacillus mesophilus]|uniref:DUF4003 domain-containing protein n=2 Tax=Bacillus mesophilus TaxID=1808955 RepID=A0A6M0QB08_9BACI|nr:DUF4003 domain-containing protein [Bacillus mesophilus]